jgi:pimeloyl-ACP methyl ester carboxylesterase
VAVSRFARSHDGARIAFETWGAGAPTLVLIHGWSCDRSHWAAQIDPLSRRWRVIALDLAGHGESERSRTGWSMAALGENVVAVLDAAGAQDVILVGHSMGATVAVEAARVLRGRVRGLIWVDQYRRLDRFPSTAEVEAHVAPFRADFAATTRDFARSLFATGADRALVDGVADAMAAAPPDIGLALLAATWHHAPKVPALLAELALPVVAVNAPHPLANAESMRRRGVEVIEMPGGGHFPMLEQPQAFIDCLQQAIETITVPRD